MLRPIVDLTGERKFKKNVGQFASKRVDSKLINVQGQTRLSVNEHTGVEKYFSPRLSLGMLEERARDP